METSTVYSLSTAGGIDCNFTLQQMEHLQAFIKECDRKIVLAKKRLAETQDDFGNTPEVEKYDESLYMMNGYKFTC